MSMRKFFSTFLKGAGLFSKSLSIIIAAKKNVKKAHSFSADNKWYTSTIKTLAWHNSETNSHLKMKFCTGAYFYETICLKINWNIDRALLI